MVGTIEWASCLCYIARPSRPGTNYGEIHYRRRFRPETGRLYIAFHSYHTNLFSESVEDDRP
jgi:hypothetical protein